MAPPTSLALEFVSPQSQLEPAGCSSSPLAHYAGSFPPILSGGKHYLSPQLLGGGAVMWAHDPQVAAPRGLLLQSHLPKGEPCVRPSACWLLRARGLTIPSSAPEGQSSSGAHTRSLGLPARAALELHFFLYPVLPASHLADHTQGSGTTPPPARESRLHFLPHLSPVPTSPHPLPQSAKCLHQVGVVLANGFYLAFQHFLHFPQQAHLTLVIRKYKLFLF